MPQWLELFAEIDYLLCFAWWIGFPLLTGRYYIENRRWPWGIGGTLLCPLWVYAILRLSL